MIQLRRCSKLVSVTIESEPSQTTFRDYLLLVAFGAVLFAPAMLTFRPMTEAEVQLASESWSIERPPLPFWARRAMPGLVLDRLPSIVAGVLTIVITSWMSSRFFDRRTGLMSGYVLTTTWQFFQSSSRATDAIYLSLLVTMAMFVFARCEWFNDQRSYATRTNPFGTRAWGVVALFALVGFSNYAHSLAIGPIIVLTSLAAFLTWNLDARRFLRYAWVWGWLSAIGVAIVWPAVAVLRRPGVVAEWQNDLVGLPRAPFWYYIVAFVVCTLPWLPLMIGGLRETWLRAKTPGTPARLILCWAIVPLIVLMILSRKEADYLVPILPAWAIIFAFGLQRVWTLVRARFPDASGAVAFRNLIILIAVIEIGLQFFIR